MGDSTVRQFGTILLCLNFFLPTVDFPVFLLLVYIAARLWCCGSGVTNSHDYLILHGTISKRTDFNFNQDDERYESEPRTKEST
jgi:hypothetical protein